MNSLELQLDALLVSEADDVLSLLGVQAEFIELAKLRGAERTPAWSDAEAHRKIFGAQRAPAAERQRYRQKGQSFLERFTSAMRAQLREALCDGAAPQQELVGFKSDFKLFVKHVAIAISAVLLQFLPAWLAVVAGSLGMSIAVLFWRGMLEAFCAVVPELPAGVGVSAGADDVRVPKLPTSNRLAQPSSRSPVQKHTILFLAANPIGTQQRELDREVHAIEAELQRSGHRERFEFQSCWAAEPLDLLRELRRLRPTVVHFSGHITGTLAPGAQPGGLFFRGPDGRAQLVSSAAIAEAFGAAGASVRLVVLNACYTDVQAEALLAHVDCVVGMSSSSSDAAARSFAIGFYGGLGEREPVAVAYRQGRAAITLEGLRDAERPQLKVRTGIDADRLVLIEY